MLIAEKHDFVTRIFTFDDFCWHHAIGFTLCKAQNMWWLYNDQHD